MALTVIIVGAGIAGLSAAISLRRAGHRVELYERCPHAGGAEAGAAIHVPPNASAPLLAWGLDPAAARFVPVRALAMWAPATMTEVLRVPVGEPVADRYGAPCFFAHRADLRSALERLAVGGEGEGGGGGGVGVPARVHLGRKVVRYDPDTPSITLADGEVVRADVVVAADGVHSIAAEAVAGYMDPPRPQKHYNTCFRFLIPASALEADPATRFWNDDMDGTMRLIIDGEGRRRLASYPCRDNEVHNFVCLLYQKKMESATQEDWYTPVDKTHVLKALQAFHPSILAVVNKATNVKRWPLLFRPPFEPWRKGRMVLAGDAAHPMLPHQGQGGAQGLEDGIALGIALAGVTSPDQIDERLVAYERIRRNRASAIQIMSNAGQDEPHLIHQEAAKYISVVPRTPQEFQDFNFGHDVIQEAVRGVQEVDPAFKLPEGYIVKEGPFLFSDLVQT